MPLLPSALLLSHTIWDGVGSSVPLQAARLRWRWRRPGVRHHNDFHFLGNRESHLYLCWEPPHLEPSHDSGSYF